jgi:hypothetical protein
MYYEDEKELHNYHSVSNAPSKPLQEQQILEVDDGFLDKATAAINRIQLLQKLSVKSPLSPSSPSPPSSPFQSQKQMNHDNNTRRKYHQLVHSKNNSIYGDTGGLAVQEKLKEKVLELEDLKLRNETFGRENAYLKVKLNHYDNIIEHNKTFARENASLEAKLKDYDKMKEENATFARENASLEAKLKDYDSEKEAPAISKSMLDELENKNKNKVNDLESKIELLEKNNKIKINDLESTIRRKQVALRAVHSKYEQLEKQHNILKHSHNIQDDKLKEAMHQVKEHNIKGKKDELDNKVVFKRHQETLDKYESNLVEQSEHIVALQRQLNEEKSGNQVILQRHEKTLDKYKSTLHQQSDRIIVLQRQLNEKDSGNNAVLQKHQEALDKCKSNLQKQSARIILLQSQLNEKESDNKAALQSHQEVFDKYKSDLQSRSDRIILLERQLKEKESDSNAIFKKNQNILDKYKLNLHEQSDRIILLERHLNEKESTIKKHTEINEKLKIIIDEKNSLCNQYKLEYDELLASSKTSNVKALSVVEIEDGTVTLNEKTNSQLLKIEDNPDVDVLKRAVAEKHEALENIKVKHDIIHDQLCDKISVLQNKNKTLQNKNDDLMMELFGMIEKCNILNNQIAENKGLHTIFSKYVTQWSAINDDTAENGGASGNEMHKKMQEQHIKLSNDLVRVIENYEQVRRRNATLEEEKIQLHTKTKKIEAKFATWNSLINASAKKNTLCKRGIELL